MTIEAARAELLGDPHPDAWGYAAMQRQAASFPMHRADPRQNAPATISSLPLDQRRRAMVDRDEGRRQAYMRAFRGIQVPTDERPVPQTRQRGEHPLISLALVIALFVGTYVMLAVLP